MIDKMCFLCLHFHWFWFKINGNNRFNWLQN